MDVTNGLTRRDERTGPRGRSIVTGGAGAAIECVALLSSVLTFAVRRGLRRENPALGIDLRRTKRRRYPTADELARLGETLARMEAERADPFAVAAIRFLCLSGCRKGEALTLKWEQVDFDRGVLCLPDSKVGARDVPVGTPALNLLLTLPRIEENPYSSPGASPASPSSAYRRCGSGCRRLLALATFDCTIFVMVSRPSGSTGASAWRCYKDCWVIRAPRLPAVMRICRQIRCEPRPIALPGRSPTH